MHRMSFLKIVTVLILLPIIGGCSKGRPMGDVQGRVSMNGEPIAKAAVRFIPIDGDTPTTGGSVQDGRFRVEVPVSKQRVEFSANVIDREKTPPNANGDQVVMKALIPPRYNKQSTLTLDVVSGLNEPEFKLQPHRTMPSASGLA